MFVNLALLMIPFVKNERDNIECIIELKEKEEIYLTRRVKRDVIWSLHLADIEESRREVGCDNSCLFYFSKIFFKKSFEFFTLF